MLEESQTSRNHVLSDFMIFDDCPEKVKFSNWPWDWPCFIRLGQQNCKDDTKNELEFGSQDDISSSTVLIRNNLSKTFL